MAGKPASSVSIAENADGCNSADEVHDKCKLTGPVLGGTKPLFELMPPQYNCQTGAFVFKTSEVNGAGPSAAPIEYMAAGITDWTSNPNQFVDQELRQAPNAQPITLMARQLTSDGTYFEDRYVWDLRAVCPVNTASVVLAAAEPMHTFQISVSPNPVDEEFSILIEGAQQQSTHVMVTDLQGRALVDKSVLVKQSTHSERINLGSVGSGIYLLRVSTKQRSQTIKVIKGQ